MSSIDREHATNEKVLHGFRKGEMVVYPAISSEYKSMTDGQFETLKETLGDFLSSLSEDQLGVLEQLLWTEIQERFRKTEE